MNDSMQSWAAVGTLKLAQAQAFHTYAMLAVDNPNGPLTVEAKRRLDVIDALLQKLNIG
jgi:hypothetical protein